MCGTMNDQTAQSCSFCGYLFEDYGTGTVNQSSPPKMDSTSTSDLNTVPETQNPASTGTFTSTTGAPLFVVGRSILGALVPSIAYLVFIVAIALFSAFSLYSVVLVLFFIVAAVIPSLMAPRRFEFYDDSLKVHKTIGRDSEFPYSSVSMLDYPNRGRRQQMVLSVVGQRRPLIIGKNPSNAQLGMDLKQFLNSKLNKPKSGSSSEQENSTSPDNNSPSI